MLTGFATRKAHHLLLLVHFAQITYAHVTNLPKGSGLDSICITQGMNNLQNKKIKNLSSGNEYPELKWKIKT